MLPKQNISVKKVCCLNKAVKKYILMLNTNFKNQNYPYFIHLTGLNDIKRINIKAT